MNNFSESLPKAGYVNEVCKEWLVREDGALAYKLQSQEINEFYKGNRFRNAVVREDFPTALHEQIKENENAQKQSKAYRRKLIEQEEHDKRVAKEIADKLSQDLAEQKANEILEGEAIARQMQEIYVNLPPPPPPVSRQKQPVPPRPAKASTLQQQISNDNIPEIHSTSKQSSQSQLQSSQISPSYLLESSHFANNDNYVGISLSPNATNVTVTPSRQKSSPQNLGSVVGNFVVSGEIESPSRNPFSLDYLPERLPSSKQQDRSPIILTNEHFLNQQQQPQHNHNRLHHSISSTSTTSSTASNSASASASVSASASASALASSSARRNVFEYHNLPNNITAPTVASSTPTKSHSPKHTLNHSPIPTTPNNHNPIPSPTLSSNHPDIDELIEYSDVADSIRRYDISEKTNSNKDYLDSSNLKHSNFNRILSPSNENLLRNDKKFQKLSPEKYDQIVGNENGAAGIPAGAAAERYMQEHADDIELYVDPCDYASLKEIGLPMHEIKEMSKKLKQEQKDELLARRLQQMESHDGLTQEERDRMLAIEAQDKELAKMLQEREKAKAKRAKEKARLRKSQQKEAGGSSNTSSLCSTSNGLHCGPILPLPQDCMTSCSSSSKHSSNGSHKHSAQSQPQLQTQTATPAPAPAPTLLQSQSHVSLTDDALDNEAYSNPIDVIQNQRSPHGLLTNGSLTRDNTKINRLQTSQSQDDDIYTLPVDSCRNGQRPVSLQVPEECIPIPHNSSMTRSENFSHDLHDTLNGQDISSRLNYSKTNSFDHSSSPTPPYMPIQGSRRLHTGEDRKKKSKDNKCTHQ